MDVVARGTQLGLALLNGRILLLQPCVQCLASTVIVRVLQTETCARLQFLGPSCSVVRLAVVLLIIFKIHFGIRSQ